jgi:7,8-dihydropterin-6-yl-methyl-4-(beta-D-ribofuranosyl)aminobenzene 5'-phosphate synthase
MDITLTVLVDNQADPPLKAQHGLALHVQTRGGSYLFDTGADADVLTENACQLGIDLARVQAVILSHGHYDHTGGLTAIIEATGGCAVYAHPGVFRARWSAKPGRPLRRISCPHTRQTLRSRGAAFHDVTAPVKIDEQILLSGPAGGGATSDTYLIRRGEDIVPDPFEDELVALLRTAGGWTVLTGCCHRGLSRTLSRAQLLARGLAIEAVVGGLHLSSASEDTVQRSADALRSFGPPALYPCHCTGAEATEALLARLGDHVHPLKTGDAVTL